MAGSKTMNKGNFVAFIQKVNNLTTKTEAEKMLNCVLNGITQALAQGDKIVLVGFGSFEAQHRKARDGRNPKTGEKMRIPAYNQPTFKAGQHLKDASNNRK